MLTNEDLATRRARIGRYVRPVQEFIETEASGGFALIAAAVLALVWANSPWASSYTGLIEHHIVVDLGFVTHDHSLHAWINDGAMVLFFFVVGLEIKREIVAGELASLRRVAVPVAAALGGMLVPAAIFVLIAGSGAAAAGWGIPMATDIAFALGVLALLGNRIPVGLKVLLLGLAIVDDIGAIVVIGIFYADSIAWGPIAVAVGTLLAAYALRQSGVWYVPLYVALGVVGWFAMMESGVHPTLIGVAFGLLTPWRSWYRAEGLVEIADGILDRFRPGPDATVAPGERGHEVGPLLNLSTASRRSVAPLDLLEHELHPLVAFVIVPAFAFANAGVPLSADALGDALTSGATIGVAAGLVVGKPLGIIAGVWLATRIGARLPDGVTWGSLAGIGMLAGIGFTVSLLIADLAYEDELLINQAKLGILFASVLAGVVGYVLLRATARVPAVQEQ